MRRTYKNTHLRKKEHTFKKKMKGKNMVKGARNDFADYVVNTISD